MKNLAILTASITTCAVFSSQAIACSYYINQVEKKNELMAAAASHLNVSLEDTTQFKVRGFNFFESKPTPMCPEEMTYNLTFDLAYMDTTALRPTQCSVTLEAKKIEDWKKNVEHFEFGSAQPTCTVVE